MNTQWQMAELSEAAADFQSAGDPRAWLAIQIIDRLEALNLDQEAACARTGLSSDALCDLDSLRLDAFSENWLEDVLRRV